MTPAAWQLHRRADRRDALVKGSGFHAFKDIPEPWRKFITRRCQFCRRGPKELEGLFALDGLPNHPTSFYCCNDCAKDIVEGKMPTGWVE